MRLTQVMLSKGFGGAERYFVDLSLALAARGHQVQAICHRKFMGLALLEHPNITVRPIPLFASWDPFGARKLEQALRDFTPAVIHTHLARAAHVAGRAAHRLDIPLVVKTHNYVDLKYYRHVDHFITTTEDQKRYLLEHTIGADRISVIPNFAMTPAASTKTPDTAHLLLFAYGRMVHKKGLTCCCKPRSNYVYRLTRPQCWEAMAPNVRATPAGRNAGIASPSTSSAAKTPADLLIRPTVRPGPRATSHSESSLEAMARGKMIVTTRTADRWKSWTKPLNGRSAMLPVRCAIRSACTSPEARAQAALARFNTHYSETAIVPRIEQLYRQLAHV